MLVRVIPRAGRTAVGGKRGEALLVRLAAAPVDGAANQALIRFIAKLLGCPARDLAMVSGEKSRDKRLRVAGLTPEELERRVSALLDSPR
jgi:uncharacterized protein (TIGR00251 family)